MEQSNRGTEDLEKNVASYPLSDMSYYLDELDKVNIANFPYVNPYSMSDSEKDTRRLATSQFYEICQKITKIISQSNLTKLPIETLSRLLSYSSSVKVFLYMHEIVIKFSELPQCHFEIRGKGIIRSLLENVQISVIQYSNISGTNLKEIKMVNSYIGFSTITSSTFINCTLGVKCSANLNTVSFINCDLSEADFSDARFEDVRITNSKYSDDTKWPTHLSKEEIEALLINSVNINEQERLGIVKQEELRQKAIEELSILNPTGDPTQFNELAINSMMKKLEEQQVFSMIDTQRWEGQKQYWRFQVQAWTIQINLLKELVENSRSAGKQRDEMIQRIVDLENSVSEAQRNISIEMNLSSGTNSEELQAQETLQRRQYIFQILNSKLGQIVYITRNNISFQGKVNKIGSDAVLVDNSWISFDEIEYIV